MLQIIVCITFSLLIGQVEKETIGGEEAESFFPSELPQQPDAAPVTLGTIGGRIGWVTSTGSDAKIQQQAA